MINLEDDIDAIEAGYEFLLAYAAQGRPPQDESGPGPHPRPELEKMLAAMQNAIEALTAAEGDFEKIILDDLRKARGAVSFVLSQKLLGSEIIDNLNASIHLRTVLTDFFLYSEAAQPTPNAPQGTGQGQWEKVGN